MTWFNEVVATVYISVSSLLEKSTDIELQMSFGLWMSIIMQDSWAVVPTLMTLFSESNCKSFGLQAVKPPSKQYKDDTVFWILV